MSNQTLGVWDVVSSLKFHEGQVVEVSGDKADVYFPGQRRIIRILQSALRFVRPGSPKEFLPPSKQPTGGPRKHPPEDGKSELIAQIAKGKKLIPKVAAAYEKLVYDLIVEVGSNWYYTKSFHPQVSSHGTGRMRNCMWIGLGIKNEGIEIGIPYADELPKKHHGRFNFELKGYHGHDCYRQWIAADGLRDLPHYRTALFDVIALAKHGHAGGLMAKDMNQEGRACPLCRSRVVVPILCGMPSPAAQREAKEGKLVLGEGNPAWHCSKCSHEWRVPKK